MTDAALMDQLIWVQAAAGEPAWTTGGTYMVVRTIRQHVEFWDRVGMLEQEQMIGRDRVTGAPLGGTNEFEDPRYDLDPQGQADPAQRPHPPGQPAHPARPPTSGSCAAATTTTAASTRPATWTRGCVFVAFNQDPERQFATIQRRLETEPMTDYITPVGGGYFFAPPGRGGGGGLGRVRHGRARLSASGAPPLCRSAVLPFCRGASRLGMGRTSTADYRVGQGAAPPLPASRRGQK